MLPVHSRSMEWGSRHARNGDVLTLQDARYDVQISFRVEVLPGAKPGATNRFLLASVSDPYSRLHLFDSSLSYKPVAAPNKNCILFVHFPTAHREECVITTQPMADGRATALAMQADGSISTTAITLNDSFQDMKEVLFAISEVREGLNASLKNPLAAPVRSLKRWDLRNFAIHGFLHQCAVVPMEKVNACNRFLLHHQGQVGVLIPGAVQGGNYGKFPGSFSQHPIVRGVLSEEAKSLAKCLLGGSIDQENNTSAQIAFRHPQLPEESQEQEIWDWHTDGYRQGISHSFSLLVGICLSEVSEELSGNLAVWPASHHVLHYCRQEPHGDIDIELLRRCIDTCEVYSDFRTSKPQPLSSHAENWHESLKKRPPLPSLGAPVQLRMKPGDVVILHPDLAHCGAPNFSSCVRQMLFFRLKLQTPCEGVPWRSWEDIQEAQATDLFADLRGVQAGLQAELSDLCAVYRPKIS